MRSRRFSLSLGERAGVRAGVRGIRRWSGHKLVVTSCVRTVSERPFLARYLCLRVPIFGFMPAYIIARVDVTDPIRYRDYINATPAVIAQYGGRFIIRGGEIVTLEGEPETHRIVVIEFPSLERAKEFFGS